MYVFKIYFSCFELYDILAQTFYLFFLKKLLFRSALVQANLARPPQILVARAGYKLLIWSYCQSDDEIYANPPSQEAII